MNKEEKRQATIAFVKLFKNPIYNFGGIIIWVIILYLIFN